MDIEIFGYKVSIKKLLLVLVFISLALYYFNNRTRTLPDGIMAPDKSIQVLVTDPAWTVGEYTITPLASFYIRARVLGTENYYNDREADLSPIDLALGWDKMSDNKVLDKISISQNHRWYFFEYDNEDHIADEYVINHSANMHMIPATPEIKRKLNSIKVNDIVNITGYLVKVETSDGYKWISSLTRSDTGSNACELVWVKSIIIE